MPNQGQSVINGSLRLIEGGVNLNNRNPTQAFVNPPSPFDCELNYIRVTVTSAELLALFTTPKLLVPAPGPGRVLRFEFGMLFYDATATAYGTASGRDLAVKYTNAAGVIASTSLPTVGLADQTTDQIRTLKELATDIAPVANAPLVLHQLVANMTTGTGVLYVDVLYSVHMTGL